MTFKNKTFCASKNCKNNCGRKMTEAETAELRALPIEYQRVSMADYCNPYLKYDKTIDNTEYSTLSYGKTLH